MKKLFLAAFLFTMVMANVYTAQASEETLTIENQTPETWTVNAEIVVPPRMGVAGESEPMCGYIDMKTATLSGGSIDDPVTAKIDINTGGYLKEVFASSSENKKCTINTFLGKSFILEITADAVILWETDGSKKGGCVF